MDCHAFRQLHGDWVDDVLDSTKGETVARHLAECPACARFDTLSRRALLVARNAPPIEVSGDFSAKLAARIAEERRARIASHGPSRAERSRVIGRTGRVAYQVGRRAAALAAVVGGALVIQAALNSDNSSSSSSGGQFESTVIMSPATSSASFSSPSQPELPLVQASSFSTAERAEGEIVVVRAMRPMGGDLIPGSAAPFPERGDSDAEATARAASVAAAAPLWPTARMAAHAANRFAEMEFSGVIPVSVMYMQR
jgi:Putative zinc-finger